MNKTNRNNTGYQGKYYDPNYRQNKAKYGDLYNPKDFAVPNPNYKPRQNQSTSSKKSSNYKGKYYDPNWHTYSESKKRAIRKKRGGVKLQIVLFFLIVNVVGFIYQEINQSIDIPLLFDDSTQQTTNDINNTDVIPSNDNIITQDINSTDSITTNDSIITPDIDTLMTNTQISVDSCDLSGNRQPNVKVNIGYDSREYYGYTNEYSQLVYVQADSLKLQNSATEQLVDGRYCESQANVEDVGGDYNRGHAIGDALGGDSNAYNIFPQLTSINSGDYNNIEMQLQNELYNGGSVTNFELKLTYPNSQTNIPSSYTMSYNLNGEYQEHKFNN